MHHSTTRTLGILVVVAAAVAGGLVVAVLMLWTTFDTQYAPGFAQRLWDKAAVGMSETELRSLLGEPLSESAGAVPERKALNYTASRSDNGNYVHYYVVVDNGKVVGKHRDIFWD